MEKVSGLISNEDIEIIISKVVDNYLIPKFHELNMNASGEWLGALSVKGVNQNRGEIWGREYTKGLAEGQPPQTDVDLQDLIKWVGFKFGLYGKEALSRAIATKRKIYNDGTRSYPQGTDLIKVLSEPNCTAFIQNEMNIIYKIRLQERLINMMKNNL